MPTTRSKQRGSPKGNTKQDTESPHNSSVASTESQEDNSDSDHSSQKSTSPILSKKKKSPKPSPVKTSRESSVKETIELKTNLQSSNSCCAKCSMMTCILTVVLIAIVFSLLFIPSWQDRSNVTYNSNPADINVKEKFAIKFKELKREFLAQDNEFWKKIKVPVMRVVQENEPDYPAVILLVVPKGDTTSQTATCLAKNYITKLSNLHTGGNKKGGYINVRNIQADSADDVKYQLDNQIQRVFDSSDHKLHTIVIDHIEALDPQVMLLFHGYCDGDHAPYKKAVIMLVLHTDLDTKVAGNLDKVVDQHLQSLWQKSLDEDKIPPLIARVANNKAMIRDEKSNTLC